MSDASVLGVMSPAILFAIPTAIWGSTWLAIKFQLGVVPPRGSVAYRFALAAVILAAWCFARGRSLAFPARTHAWIAAQGATFFGLNYIGMYVAERFVTSGLVAVVFSTIVFMTPIGTRHRVRHADRAAHWRSARRSAWRVSRCCSFRSFARPAKVVMRRSASPMRSARR